MSLFKNNSDRLDEAVHQVADDPIDPRQVEEAAARVWARLSQESASMTQTARRPLGGRRSGRRSGDRQPPRLRGFPVPDPRLCAG